MPHISREDMLAYSFSFIFIAIAVCMLVVFVGNAIDRRRAKRFAVIQVERELSERAMNITEEVWHEVEPFVPAEERKTVLRALFGRVKKAMEDNPEPTVK